MQQQQVGAAYGAPGMAQQAPSYPTSSPNPPYNSSPNYPQYDSISSYSYGQNFAPSSPMLSSSSSGYAASYPAATYSAPPQAAANYSVTHENPSLYAQEPPAYVPPPPDASTYSYSIQDPSYSPRAPSFDRLPSHERSSFEPSAVGSATSPYNSTAPAQSWSTGYDYQLNRSTSYPAYGVNAVDPYPSAGYSQAGLKWGYDQLAGDEVPASSDTSYGHEPPSSLARYGSEKSYTSNSRTDYSGVYAYDGGNSLPYGSKGTGTARWTSENINPLEDLPKKLAKALPKVESESKGGGVQKYHVKLLQDSSSVGLPTNVVCQIGLDGVRLVDPGTNRTLRIYPLDTITKWEVNEPSVFTFWAKSAVDFEQRRTRLQSSRATTNAILDTLTAACIQICEMVKDGETAKSSSTSNSTAETQKKASFAEWLIRRPPAQEEKEHWVPDEAVTKCTSCASDFGPFLRRHHCRNCGDIFCDKCTRGRTPLTSEEDAPPVRVCDRCLAEVTQRLTNTKEVTNKFVSQHTHEDLAKKLQEEMERNAPRKTVVETERSTPKSGHQTSLLNCSKCGSISIVTGSTTRCPSCGSDSSSGRNGVTKKTARTYTSSTESSRCRTREVACPTCTVHLEVEVPSYGEETVECGVCQHPFLVSA